MSGKQIDGVVQALIEVAVGKVQHLYRGTCPDAIEGFDSRDPQCPACRVLIAAQEAESRAERLAEALRLALDSHGKTLLTDPPQDAWKVHRVEEIGRAALRGQEEGRG